MSAASGRSPPGSLIGSNSNFVGPDRHRTDLLGTDADEGDGHVSGTDPQAAEADLCIFILWSWFELSLGNVKPSGGGDRHSRDHYVNRSR
jgi:hypothetical protein